MKKTLRCLGLAGILGLTLWVSQPQPAHALPACAFLQRQPCWPLNSKVACSWEEEGLSGTCHCMLQGWICVIQFS
ncbi:MAG TPA: hypothetical protein VEL74_14045 [Thermoanaerobaculia bacterium]|nr:hypothetical protein [Thermoanaerobaculia bacterium]